MAHSGTLGGVVFCAAALAATLGASIVACGATPRSDFDSVDGVEGGPGKGGEGGGFQFDSGGADAPPPCRNLQCQQQKCGSGDTTVTGTVFAPNGRLPLYNAIVYVPNGVVAPIPKGVTCDQCGAVASGEPVVTALSGADGKFTLRNVPVGSNIPLVIQLGKWRRQVVIPEVKACQETRITDPELTRLPKKQSEGNMPHIALTSGGCDKLGCMLPKVGIDPSEFGTAADGDAKAVHTYLGGGGGGPSGAQPSRPFWSNFNAMKAYDLMVLSCECSESPATKDAASYQAMTQYLGAGGRIFTTDFMYTWYKFSPDAVAKTIGTIPGGAPTGGNPFTLDTSFPKGQALSDWMNVSFPGTNGKVQCDVVFNNVSSIDPAKGQTWSRSGPAGNPAGTPNNPRVFTANFPAGQPPEKQCGKGVHIDAHVNQQGTDAVNASYPSSCGSPLKPAEGLFAFFFFDLASCIQKEDAPPVPPALPR